VVRCDRPLSAAQTLDSVDAQDVRRDAVDPRAERDEEPAEILDVRLAGRVADHRLARRQGRGHDGVLGGHDARLVQEDVRPAKSVRPHLVEAVQVDLRAELGERVDVRVEAAPADHVAAGRRHDGPGDAREQRTGEEERRANPAGELGIELVRVERRRVDADLVRRSPVDICAEIGDQLHHRLDVPDVRHVRQAHRLIGQQARREDRKRAVLVPRSANRPVQRPAPFDHEGLGGAAGDRSHRGSLPRRMEVTRDRAWETLTRYTKSEALLRHALAVEASVGWYARHFGEDEERWRVVALLHDFDYEIHPTLDKHPQDGAPILRKEGYPEDVIEAVLSHAEHLEMPRDTLLKRTLFACDELAGFIHACGLVRPTGIEGLEPKSVKKKLKQPSFAAGVHRDEVYAGAEGLGIDLDEHIRNVIEAMQPIAEELGLRTAATAEAS
jgi:putative nucleotidyltransferase with HDIG domain